MTTSLDFPERQLDQFYTKADVARSCLVTLEQYLAACRQDWLFVEPSAGGGAFFDWMPEPKIGLDICSGHPGVRQVDFLSWHPSEQQRKIAVIGNPPFGKNASLARRFFDHAAAFADVIAFIVPRTFEKPMFVNRLNRHMHLVSSKVLDDCSFELAGKPYAVPTCFQIWQKREVLRPLFVAPRDHRDFDFVTQRVGDFAFQRVGARAGLVSREGLMKSPQSHYFIKSHIGVDRLLARLASLDWEKVKWRTAGNPSIGKAELVATYASRYG